MNSNIESENNNNDFDNNKLSKIWTNRFIYAAIIQGAIIVGLTIFLVFSQISFLKPEISRVIAAGGAETWFTFGYIMYVVVGVIGVAVSALFYYYLEQILEKPYNKRLTKTTSLDTYIAYESWNNIDHGSVNVCWIYRRSRNASTKCWRKRI